MPPIKSYPIDGTSLVNPALHHPAIMELLNTELSRPVMEHVADRVIEVVDFALGRPSTSARGRLHTRRRCAAAEFIEFAKQVIERAGIRMPGLLGTLVYLDRAKTHLQLSLEEWACERVFLGALICSNKYLNDSTLKNVHWSMCTGLFNRRDIGRIEREFLDVLDFEMRISEADILMQHQGIVALQPPKYPRIQVPSPLPATITRPPFRHRSDSDSSTYSDDSVSSGSLPATPPSPSMDVDAQIHSPSEGDSYSDEEDLQASIPLPRLFSTQKQKPKDDPIALPRLSAALNLLRVPLFHASS